MSFKDYIKTGKNDVIDKEDAPNDKCIKDPKTTELPKIDQGSKERINLFDILKNMKWKNHELNRTEFSSTDEPEYLKPHIVTRQIISHEPTGQKNQLLRNHVINRKIPEAKPKVQINRPSQKLTKPQNNPKKLLSLNISARNANTKINGSNPQNQELIDTQNKIAKVQAQLQFLKNNPDYIPEMDANDNKPKESENQELSYTLNEIAKVQAKLEFLKSNPDYIPETNECIPRVPKRVDLKAQKKNEPNVSSNKIKENPKNSSKVLLKSKLVIKIPTPASPLADIQKLREAETKVAETKTKLALMKNYTNTLLQKEYEEKANALTKQPDTLAEAKNNVAKAKLQLEILEDDQEESFEDYRQRMQKCSRRRKSNKLDTIIEEESEVFEDGCEEQEDATEVEEIIAKKVDQEKLEVVDKEECETINEEECKTPDEEKFKLTSEKECESLDEESQDINKEEQEDNENTESFTAISENENNNSSQNFDTKISAQQKEELLDILKKNSWGTKKKSNKSLELKEVQLTKSTNDEVVESSDSPKKHDIKFDDLEMQSFDIKKADNDSPKACKEDIFTSFFKNKSLHEEKMVSSEKSLLKFRKLQEELLESSSVDTPKTEEVHTKSTSKNESEKSHASEDGSLSSFFEDKPSIKSKHKVQNNPTKSVSDQSKSKESKKSILVEAIEFNLKQSNRDDIVSKVLKCKLEQDKRDETTSEGLKRQSSSIKCNMETDKKTVKLSTHKIINVAPCETPSPMELEYSENFESDSSDKLTKPNSQYTEVCDFTSDSCSEKEKSLKIESVHTSEESRQSFICHLYKVKIRIKSVSWRDSGNMEAVTLSFYNPFTKENAAVQRKFVLPHFYTADFYCSIPYISPPNILHSSLAYYSPVILISKRNSVTELARGVLNLNKNHTNVPLTKNGKIIGDIMLSAKVLDYGPLGDEDDSSNEIIEIVFKETKSSSSGQRKKKHLIAEEFSSSGDNTFSDVPPDQLFKKRPFRYKRKTKSKRKEDKIEKQKSFVSNCKDIQTDVQEEDIKRIKSKSKMIQTESEMDSKYITSTLQCESKVTQTEATSKQQTVSTSKNEQPKKYKMVETMKLSPLAENEQYKKNQIIGTDKNNLPKKFEIVVTNENLSKSSNTNESEENWKPAKVKKVSSEPLKHRKLKQFRAEEIYSESEEIKSIKLKQKKSSRNFKSGHQKLNHETEVPDLAEKCTEEVIPEAVHKYLQGKKLAERFFKVCTERKPPVFDKMTYEEQKLFKCNYVKKLRDALPSDFVTPPSIDKIKEKNSSERRWISHMAAFLHKQKAMSSDGSSSAVDKTDDQVPEMHSSEVAASDVLINNPDYHAMKKYYHPELCQADVMTSTSCPYFRPPTTECGVQTSERVLKNFTAQTKETLLPLLSKSSKKLANKTSELQTCLVIVDTIPSSRSGGEKVINKNILYEKVCEPEKLQGGKTKDVKKSIRLSKSNVQLESYPGRCASVMPNKNLVPNLQFELQDFVKNIKLELHILKHRAQNTSDGNVHHRKNTDFERLVNSFTSLVARNEERDFNAVYSELQQLQDMVYNRFKKFSKEHLGKPELRSKTKQLKNVDNYVSQDKELKLIYKNPKMDQAPERKSHDNNYYRQKPSRG